MKTILTLLTILIWTTAYSQTKDSSASNYYPSGQVKERGELNKSGFKNGEFIYYAANGNIDSSITFKNGKLNGLKKIYYSQDDIFYFDYHNNKLVDHKIYDSAGNLKYHSPLKKRNIPKTKYYFKSSRNYYDHNKLDTLIISEEVPYMNQNVYFPGATVKAVGKYSWEIKSWHPQPNSEKWKTGY